MTPNRFPTTRPKPNGHQADILSGHLEECKNCRNFQQSIAKTGLAFQNMEEPSAKVVQNILREAGLDEESIEAIRRHNEVAAGVPRETAFQHSLAAGETITGLIIATTLVYPDKKLASVKPKSITKRMKEKAFAASVSREIIRECELINIPLPEFAALSLAAMCTISTELGL